MEPHLRIDFRGINFRNRLDPSIPFNRNCNYNGQKILLRHKRLDWRIYAEGTTKYTIREVRKKNFENIAVGDKLVVHISKLFKKPKLYLVKDGQGAGTWLFGEHIIWIGWCLIVFVATILGIYFQKGKEQDSKVIRQKQQSVIILIIGLAILAWALFYTL